MGQLDQRSQGEVAATDAATPAAAPGKKTRSSARHGKAPTSFPSPVAVKVTASSLRVRTSPSTSSPANIVGRYRRGHVVQAYGREGDWLRVDHDGQAAFVHGKYVRVSADAAPPEVRAEAPADAPPEGPDFIDNATAAGSTVADQIRAVFFWLKDVVDHDCEEDHQPDVVDGPPVDPAAPPAPVPVEEDPVAPPAVLDGPVSPNSPSGGHEPPPLDPPIHVPAGAAELADQGLAAFLASQNHPAVTALAHDLAAAEKAMAAIKQHENEEIGADRDAHVATIGALRQQVAALDGAGLDPAALGQVKARLYRAIAQLAPYYSQGRNMNVLEGESTRTCNITSLAMALEALGKSAADYTGSLKELGIIAGQSDVKPHVSNAKHQVQGDKLQGLRLPDFLQLAAIAECGSITSADQVLPAAAKAWDNILGMWFLRQLAGKFGVSGQSKDFTLDPNKAEKEQDKDLSALSGFGKKHRSDVEALVDARNKAEASGSEKDQAKYEKLLKAEQKAMDGDGKLPIEAYKQAITSQVGADLDSGAAIVVLISGHYVRLQAIHDDHVVVDDPGRSSRANRKVLWEEARAMGYFKSRLVLR